MKYLNLVRIPAFFLLFCYVYLVPVAASLNAYQYRLPGILYISSVQHLSQGDIDLVAKKNSNKLRT